MFHQLVSAITDDDNPHLHKVPFVLLWLIAYGLAWFVLYIYEMIWYDWTFDGLLSWLKYSGQGSGEAIVLGLLFGLTLSFIQTWLIRLRYGYVPKFWRAATILGAIIAGFGYPRVGLRIGEYLLGLNWMGVNNPPRGDSLINDFLIWFIAVSLFQAVVMLQVNRKAWLIIAVGLLAGIVASVPLLEPRLLFGKPLWTLIMGTMIQAFGTSLLFLYLMAEPRAGAVPKRDESRKSKAYLNGTLATTPFILLWIGIYYLHLVLQVALPELWGFFVYYSPNALYYGLNLDYSSSGWLMNAIYFGIIGCIIAITQHWLIKKYSDLTIKRWHLFTIIGWVFAGIVWWSFRYVYPQTALERAVKFGSYLAIPTLFQAVPMNRAFKGGWIWAVIGVMTGVLGMVILEIADWRMSSFYGRGFAGLALSFYTAFVFLRLRSHYGKPQPPLELGS
jgi:hypothetical protein